MEKNNILFILIYKLAIVSKSEFKDILKLMSFKKEAKLTGLN